MVGDVLLGQRGRDVLEAVAGGGPLPQEIPHGVGDLLAAAVPHRDIDVHARVGPVPRGPLRAVVGAPGRGRGGDGAAQAPGDGRGQQIDRADQTQAPAAGGRELIDGVGDDVQQRGQLSRIP